MNDTRTATPVTEALTEYDASAYGQAAFLAGKHLADAVRAELAPLPAGEAGRMAAEAERAARTMAPPVPGVTQNTGYTVRAVIHVHDAKPGLLAAWVVACEDAGRGTWVTWDAYCQDGKQAGFLAYNDGHYFNSPARACRDGLNRQRALADLAARAGLMPEVAQLIADEMSGTARTAAAEDRRAARRIRAFFAR